jgi:DNA-binding MarR family transcriptional regulator
MIGALLRRLGEAVNERVHEVLLDAGYHDIPVSHHVVFQQLGRGGARLGEMAERAGMTKQSMQYLVDLLERGGYVERRPDPRDARAKIVRLTDHGRDVERVARSGISELERAWSQRIGHAEFESFMAALRELSTTLEESG